MIPQQELDQAMRTMKGIWAALVLSLLVYAVLVLLLLDDTHIDFPADVYRLLKLILFALAIVTLIASWGVRRLLLARSLVPKTTGRITPHPAIQRYTTAMIMALAMSEAIGIYGLILFLLGKQKVDLYLLVAIAMAAMVLFAPKREEVMRLAELFAAGA
jgi:hypothetical protein